MTAIALPRRTHATPARSTDTPSPAPARWLSVLVVGVLLAAFGLAARGGR